MGTRYNPRVVTDGLALALDAGNVKSYNTSGTTWTDISGNQNQGTLSSQLRTDVANRGSLYFNGTSDRVEVGTFSLSYLTVSTWVRKTSTATHQGICRKQNSWAISQYNGTLQVAPGTSWAFYNTGYTIPLNKWVNIVYTYSGTGTTGSQSVYVDGELISTFSNGSGALPTNSNIVRIGFDDNGWWWGGFIAETKIYDRALSESEIKQNFNALRDRFGI